MSKISARRQSARNIGAEEYERKRKEILRVAAAESAELIVIVIRHRTPVGKLLLGSTSQQVLLDAPCAVLAVKARTSA